MNISPLHVPPGVTVQFKVQTLVPSVFCSIGTIKNQQFPSIEITFSSVQPPPGATSVEITVASSPPVDQLFQMQGIKCKR